MTIAPFFGLALLALVVLAIFVLSREPLSEKLVCAGMGVVVAIVLIGGIW